MTDFLIRLIERSRGLSPEGLRVEPLISPLYAAGSHTAPPDDELYEEMEKQSPSIVELETHSSISQRRDFASDIAGTAFVRGPKRNASVAAPSKRRRPRDIDALEIESARAPDDETQSRPSDRNPGVEPLPRTIAVPSLARANEIARLTDQPRRAGETVKEGESVAPIIRVTIGRIDVRAVAAPEPLRRESPAATPKLSLEEYLRSRSGRK
jgi:hypothetical protein